MIQEMFLAATQSGYRASAVLLGKQFAPGAIERDSRRRHPITKASEGTVKRYVEANPGGSTPLKRLGEPDSL